MTALGATSYTLPQTPPTIPPSLTQVPVRALRHDENTYETVPSAWTDQGIGRGQWGPVL